MSLKYEPSSEPLHIERDELVTDLSEVDMLGVSEVDMQGVWYYPVNFRAEKGSDQWTKTDEAGSYLTLIDFCMTQL